MSDGTYEVDAAAIAQTALAIAKGADKKAEEAKQYCRSVYQALGQIREVVAHLERLVKDVQAEFGQHGFDSVRPPPPDDSNGDV